jgi:SAM-dependent methyltransferase
VGAGRDVRLGSGAARATSNRDVGLFAFSARTDVTIARLRATGAINRARERSAHLPNVHFEQSDMLHLPKDLDGRFDLVLVLDVLYYLSPLDAELLKQLAERTVDLLVPGGLCVLVNHYFFAIDSNSRLSRLIHRAFKDSPHFSLVSEHRRPFFLVSFLETSPGPALPEFSKVAS